MTIIRPMMGPHDDWRRVANLQGPPNSETYMRGGVLVAIRSVDHGRWHLSVSHRDRIPTWGELGDARDALLPAHIHFMVPHPPRRFWVNYNRRVLHLWECRDHHLLEVFEHEGRIAQSLGAGTPDGGE